MRRRRGHFVIHSFDFQLSSKRQGPARHVLGCFIFYHNPSFALHLSTLSCHESYLYIFLYPALVASFDHLKPLALKA
jgi:hypothetical protein